jgi:predicted  nucleic acid-binding Zn-ribbon protein
MTLKEFTDSILGSIEDERLVLHENILPSDGLNKIFSTYLRTEQLTITKAEVTPSDTQLIIRGESSFLDLDNVETEFTFEEVDQDIQLKLVTNLTDQWHFSHSFPTLSSTSLALLDLSDSTLILSSIPQEDGSANGKLLKGLQITSQVTPNTVFSPLNMLWDETVKFPLHGTISQNGTQSSVDLQLDIPDDLVLDNLTAQDLQINILGPVESEWGAAKDIALNFSGRLLLGSHELGYSMTLPNGSTVLSLTITPEEMVLPDLVALAELLPGVDLDVNLPDGLPELNQFQLRQIDLSFDLSAKEIFLMSIVIELHEAWSAIPGQFSFANPNVIWYINQPFDAQARTAKVVFGGEASFSNIIAEAFMSAPDFVLTGDIPQIELAKLVEIVAVGASLPEQLSDLTLENVTFEADAKSKTFAFTGQSASPLEMSVGTDGVQIQDILCDIMIDPSQDDGPEAISGNLTGILAIGTNRVEIHHNFPGDIEFTGHIPAISLSLLLQEFCGGEIIRNVPLPTSILETELNDVAFKIAPQRKLLSFAAETPFGLTEIIIKQTSAGDWGFSIGFVPPDTWKFSAIDPALAVLNDLDFSGSTLIVSSSDDSDLALTTIELPQAEAGAKKGLNFFANLDTSALGVKEMLPGFDLDSLQVYAAIGNDPQTMVIEAAVEGEFQIDKSTAFGDITFRLKPAPTDFEVSLFGTVTTVIDDSPLLFIGGLGVTAPPPAGSLQAAMVGTWDNPFGTQNLSVSNVGLDLKLPPLSIGITGGLRVGDFEGQAAVGINTANPTQSMLAVEFDELQLVDIFEAFCPPQVRQAIPRNLATTVLDVEFEDVKIHIVPVATKIGKIEFEQGITLQGRMIFWGLTADGFLNIDQGSGIVVKGDVDEIILGNIFKLTGSAGKPKASLLADLRLGQSTSVDISGAVELLGISREAAISISDTGFLFTTSGKIFDLFEAALVVSGSDMVNGDGIMVKATMQNDLFDYLGDKTSAEIEAAAKEATRELEDAQRDVDRAQADVNKLNTSITAMRHTIEAERERDSKRLRAAQNAVQREQNKVNSLNQQISNMRNTIRRERARHATNLRNARQRVQNAQNKVNGLNRDISNMRRTVRAGRDRDTANLRRAQRSVNNAQNKVNSIQKDIDSTKSRIRTINSQIAAKKRWLDSRPWYDKVWAGPEYAAYESAKRVEQAALYSKIAGLETAKHSALGVLEAARWALRTAQRAIKTFPIDSDPRVAGLITARATATAALNAAKAALRGLEKAAKTFPIDADPRMVGLFAARNTATGALTAANLALKAIKAVIKVFPVDADPRMLGLFTARETAKGSLEVAKFTLEGVKGSVKGMAEVSQFIADGQSKLLVINEAMFEASLSATHGGSVSLAVKLVFMNEPHDLAFDFNFHDPMSSAKALAELLLPE